MIKKNQFNLSGPNTALTPKPEVAPANTDEILKNLEIRPFRNFLLMSAQERRQLGIVGVGAILSAVACVLIAGFLFLTELNGSEPAASHTIAANPTEEEPTELAAEPTNAPTATPTSTATSTPEPTVAPTETPLPTATSTSSPTAEPTATATATATPTHTPTPTPSPTPTQIVIESDLEWLNYINQFRLQAGVPLLEADDRYIEGSIAHSAYMVMNGDYGHGETVGAPGYSEAGQRAAKHGNVYADIGGASYTNAVHFWVAAPFHGVPLLDPKLGVIGYGDFTQGNSFGATLEYATGLPQVAPPELQFPYTFPKDGGKTWIRSQRLFEFPEAVNSCGYGLPAGSSIYVYTGDGTNTPHVQSYSLSTNGSPVEACLFDETSYSNASEYSQITGRVILDTRDALVLIPREKLVVGNTYTAEVTYTLETASGGTAGPFTINWSFDVVSSPDP